MFNFDVLKDEMRELERRVRKVNHLINGLNIKLHKALRRDDSTFVSRTTLESTRYKPQNIVVLRAVLVNPLTTRQIAASPRMASKGASSVPVIHTCALPSLSRRNSSLRRTGSRCAATSSRLATSMPTNRCATRGS